MYISGILNSVFRFGDTVGGGADVHQIKESLTLMMG